MYFLGCTSLPHDRQQVQTRELARQVFQLVLLGRVVDVQARAAQYGQFLYAAFQQIDPNADLGADFSKD